MTDQRYVQEGKGRKAGIRMAPFATVVERLPPLAPSTCPLEKKLF